MLPADFFTFHRDIVSPSASSSLWSRSAPYAPRVFLMSCFDNSGHALRVFCLDGAFVPRTVPVCGNQQHPLEPASPNWRWFRCNGQPAGSFRNFRPFLPCHACRVNLELTRVSCFRQSCHVSSMSWYGSWRPKFPSYLTFGLAVFLWRRIANLRAFLMVYRICR